MGLGPLQSHCRQRPEASTQLLILLLSAGSDDAGIDGKLAVRGRPQRLERCTAREQCYKSLHSKWGKQSS
jgi:hypothetical protein